VLARSEQEIRASSSIQKPNMLGGSPEDKLYQDRRQRRSWAEASEIKHKRHICMQGGALIGPGRVVIRVSTAAVHVCCQPAMSLHRTIAQACSLDPQRSVVAWKHGSQACRTHGGMGKTTAAPRCRPCHVGRPRWPLGGQRVSTSSGDMIARTRDWVGDGETAIVRGLPRNDDAERYSKHVQRLERE
jgi:hypothetical protein